MDIKLNKRAQLIRIALVFSLALTTVLSGASADRNVLVTVAHATLAPATVVVDCDAGDKLQIKLNAASAGDTPQAERATRSIESGEITDHCGPPGQAVRTSAAAAARAKPVPSPPMGRG